MKTYFLIFALFFFCSIHGQPWNDHGRLVVPEDYSHYLKYADGTPFFWLGDTGWELIHRLSREEIASYIQTRKEQGFNVIQTVIISEFIHSDKPVNFYNDSIFIQEDPLKPAITTGDNPADAIEYDFWDHVDYAVKTAASEGMYIALVPSWGEWVIPRTDKPLFNTLGQAYEYGHFIGNRYGKYPNIIWILGGDRHPDERKEGIALWRAMAEGIADGVNQENKYDGRADYSNTLMTHHSFNSSSQWFHNDDWIDFHMWGSYHAEINNPKAWQQAILDWNLESPKPTMNGEPCYEGHGINYAVDDNGYFTSTDVRLAAYWSVFSGCAGFTYGAQPVWQFTDETRPKYSAKTLMNWQEGLKLPGASMMKYLKNLMESFLNDYPLPDESVITGGQGDCGDHLAAIRNESRIMVYIPTGHNVSVDAGVLKAEMLKASWFNPRNGEITKITSYKNNGPKEFAVPGMSESLNWLRSGRGCDWVLIIEKEE
ncbi:MAG TPA: glycoside hydrolase family 140 protein [Bacteroidales bacterium]|nr:glycoside hydrolase family 140 protein [Bacteroidales bacterium]